MQSQSDDGPVTGAASQRGGEMVGSSQGTPARHSMECSLQGTSNSRCCVCLDFLE